MLLTVSANLKFERDGTRAPLGTGHFGQVYVARDLQLDAPVAVKCVAKAGIGDPSEFFSEAARLYMARHPHVVQVLYACEDADMVYIAMPVYERSLDALLQARMLTVREVITLGVGMLSGLHHIHTRGLVHADVKPGNVLISSSGQAAVSDFGLARHIDQNSGTADAGVFYWAHVPPERLMSPAITTRFDVYQAGVTLYRMLYGEEHFRRRVNGSGSGLKADAAAGTLYDYPNTPHVPEALRRAVKRAMSPNPDDRQTSCLEFANDLAKIDRMLDWRLSHSDDTMIWRNEGDSRDVEVRLVTGADASCSVSSTKKHGSGRRRVTQHCAESLVRETAIRSVRAALRELD